MHKCGNMAGMRWDDGRHFLAALRAGSFGDAARELGVEQSTVSRRVAALEDALGAELFQRTPRGLVPTELAQRLRPHAEQLEASVRAMHAEAADEAHTLAGAVRVAMTETMAVMTFVPALEPLLVAHPELRIEITTGFEVVSLLRREADLALRFAEPTAQELVSRRIAEFNNRVIVHRRYLERIGAVTSVDDVDFITLDRPLEWMVEYQWFQKHIGRTPRVRSNSYMAQIAAVRAGLGAALLPLEVAEGDPDVVELPLDLPPGPQLPLWLVAHRAVRHLPRIALMWDSIVQLASELTVDATSA